MIDISKSISMQRHVSTLTGRQQAKIHLCLRHIKVHKLLVRTHLNFTCCPWCITNMHEIDR